MVIYDLDFLWNISLILPLHWDVHCLKAGCVGGDQG